RSIRRIEQGRVAEELDLEFDDLRADRAARRLEALELGRRPLQCAVEKLPLGGRRNRLVSVDVVQLRHVPDDETLAQAGASHLPFELLFQLRAFVEIAEDE